MRIRTSGLSEKAREHARDLAEKRIRRVLGRSTRHVARLSIRLGDLNGPRGGVDKFCVIDLQLHKGPRVRVRARHERLAAAVQEAASRARRAVYRELGRNRRIDRRRVAEVREG